MDVGDIWRRVIHFCVRSIKRFAQCNKISRVGLHNNRKKRLKKKNMGKDDENEASKLLCGCNYQGGRRDRPASLRLMHQRQPIIIDFFLFFTFFKQERWTSRFFGLSPYRFFESLNGELRVFLIRFWMMSIVNFIKHFISSRMMSIFIISHIFYSICQRLKMD